MDKKTSWVIMLLLVVAVVTVYGQTFHFGYVNLDDPQYITDNSQVKAGLTLGGVRWAFTTFHDSHWFPLTWLCYMLGITLFGQDPGAQHAVNVAFHAVNTILLFLVLRRMTGAVWRSTLVAALFALHPLHVESVAWIASRKDLLSTSFWLLTTMAYCRYAEKPGLWRYLPVMVFFACGLLSKPMLVTLPFALLLLDYWPLRRFQGNKLSVAATPFTRSSTVRLLLEKMPLVILAAGSSMVTLWAMKTGKTLSPHVNATVPSYIANALVSYLRYLGKMFWPLDLAVFYPFDPAILGYWQVGGAILLLLALTGAAIRWRWKYPFVITGWLWYLGTLVPVVGFIHVGGQAMADRYTYVPLIGPFIIIAWWLWEVAMHVRRAKIVIICGAILCVGILAGITRQQVGFWRDDFTLLNHALAITKDNYLAHNNLGIALLMQEMSAAPPASAQGGQPDQEELLGAALNHFSEAVRIKPDYMESQVNIGVIHALRGDAVNAIESFQKALRIDPNDVKTRLALANIYLKTGAREKALEQWAQLKKIDAVSADSLLEQINSF